MKRLKLLFIILIALCFLLPSLLFSQWQETTIAVGSAPPNENVQKEG